MCGINGTASVKGQNVQERDWLKTGLNLMAHRGPDDCGEWWSDDGKVGLGHRRLSILDLSNAGHQPMHLPALGLHIVFNGEIYNFQELRKELKIKGHEFSSGTDTEVLLFAYKEWGTGFLNRLNGMFAFAIYDESNRKLIIARDRAGEKPLFYAHSSGNHLVFASELKGLVAHKHIDGKINPESLDCLLAMGFVPHERSILEGVNKLPPAHALEYNIESGELNVWKYWEIPEFTESGASEEELLEELEALLEDSVRRQLVADVPVGILLSGGVDSSLVTAMAARTGQKIKTFTVGFPGHSKFDETPYAKLIANHFGTEHTELSGSEVSIDLLPRLAAQFDEPLVDSSMIPTYLVTELIKKHCTVALGGDGGDELFGGYGHHSRLVWMFEKMGKIPGLLRRPVSKFSGLLPTGFKGRVWLQNLGTDMKSDLPLIASLFDAKARSRLMSSYEKWPTVAEGIRQKAIPQQSDLIQRATRMDFLNYMPEDILVKVDRASMLNSLELRAPLLDYRLVEFAYGKVPSHLKTNSNERKIILKKLTERVLPPDFDKQRKQGFGVPIGSWLKEGKWHDFANDILTSQDSLFDRKFVSEVLAGQRNGRENTERLFGLIMVELWSKQYGFSL